MCTVDQFGESKVRDLTERHQSVSSYFSFLATSEQIIGNKIRKKNG
ncbi:hypothetical protein Y11_07811 [Yersinia enterocolitica subsp. palearctica Y11]|uniref:Uncharacterized protein n=1 Tax=Yersinia enterocolitica subsp. palearctica serotype O:3 (strain DSM 13030 / CIP 106945 / Y11) TaxID=930944 RepID=A0A0H3NQD4_YERE1|nr:hypothetical protein Y11_07811 [Yersinia enterocolitica subsp. palearctica Y11]